MPEQAALYLGSLGLARNQGEAYFTHVLQGITDVDQFLDYWKELFRDAQRGADLELMPGARSLLDYLAGTHMPLAIATSSQSDEAQDKLQRVGIEDFFKFVVTGDQVRRSKPDPDIYIRTAGQLGVSAEHCLALEDSDNGVRSAHAAGMTVFHIPDLAEPGHGLTDIRVRVITSLQHAAEILQGQRVLL